MKSLILICALCYYAINMYAQSDNPNVIFIVADDLNDYVGILGGHPQVSTPHIDSLAARGVSFVNAYASAPGCAPSRTSFLSGKDIHYTQVYNNTDYIDEFRNNFSDEKNNALVYTLPQILKDSGNYYTYEIDKIFHSPRESDFDDTTEDICEKHLSWNKFIDLDDFSWFNDVIYTDYEFGDTFAWGMIPDDDEVYMKDYRATDSAIEFINAYAAQESNTCGQPFFLSVGYHRPHADRFIPQKYFPPYYQQNILAQDFKIPFNYPLNSTPYNGIVLPPQPETEFSDYDVLPENGVAQDMVKTGSIYYDVINYRNNLPYLPVFNYLISDEQKIYITDHSVYASYVMAYIAAVQFVDAQVGRIMDAMASNPELLNNTIIIFTSDHGYSLSEKRHWTKWSLWETDIRIPLIVSLPAGPTHATSQGVVSLLDLFPTVCDLCHVPYPTYADGAKYLDGTSMLPLLNQPELQWEKPALTTAKNFDHTGSCYPHYSVRTNRFHYIIYKTNSGGTGDVCDNETSYYQEELYDVGTLRETDPEEWHNLITEADYKPIVQYMQQFLPDSNLYLQKVFSVQIQNNALPCLLSDANTINLDCTLYDTAGNVVLNTDDYTFMWTNNLTDQTTATKSNTFSTTDISLENYEAATQLMFYLHVFNTATGKLEAFTSKTFFINTTNIPQATFSTQITNAEVSIINYALNGTHESTSWDFGDGYTTNAFIPGPHSYAQMGNYEIKNIIKYGNGCSTIFSKTITIDSLPVPKATYTIYPNPASAYVFVEGTQIVQHASLVSIDGKVIWQRDFTNAISEFHIDVSKYAQGIYILKIETEDADIAKRIEVLRN